MHKEEIRELLQKKIVYTEDYINELLEIYPDIFIDKRDIQKMIFGAYVWEEDINKRPLSKLIKDIADDFGLL